MSDNHTPDDGGASASSDGGVDPSAGAETPATPTAETPGRRKATKRRNFLVRHKVLVSLAVVLLLLAGTAGGYLYWVNNQIGNIKRVDAGITNSDKDESKEPLNILLLGADHGAVGQSVAEDLEDGEWTPFEHLSDTIILVHIPADRESIQLVSIPRDTWTKIEGYPYTNEHAKINAAFSYGGPSLARQTVEDLTDIPIDHMAIIDWVGFKELTTALGGVRVYVPEAFYDESQRVEWEQGWQTLEGEPALQYVRTRHGLSDGDFGRIERQQNFLRATMGQLLSTGTTRNPIKLTKVVGVITEYLTVDSTWDNDEIRNLALSLRDIHSDDVDFLTAPLGKYGESADGQSIVRLAKKQSEALFTALQEDDIEGYLQRYPDERLPDDKSVN